MPASNELGSRLSLETVYLRIPTPSIEDLLFKGRFGPHFALQESEKSHWKAETNIDQPHRCSSLFVTDSEGPYLGPFAQVGELMVNGPGDVYVERKGRLERVFDGGLSEG